MTAGPIRILAKVTCKYHVAIPRAIADRYGIRPGDQIEWVAAGAEVAPQDQDARLRFFDEATKRHRRRPSASAAKLMNGRGWKREDLYSRGRTR